MEPDIDALVLLQNRSEYPGCIETRPRILISFSSAVRLTVAKWWVSINEIISWITIYEWKKSASNFPIYSIGNENESEHSLTSASTLIRNGFTCIALVSLCKIHTMVSIKRFFFRCILLNAQRKKSSFWKWKNRRTASVDDAAKSNGFLFFIFYLFWLMQFDCAAHSHPTTPIFPNKYHFYNRINFTLGHFYHRMSVCAACMPILVGRRCSFRRNK